GERRRRPAGAIIMRAPRKVAAAGSRQTGSKSAAKGAARRRKNAHPLPDLSNIVLAFYDAQALVAVAHTALAERDDYGPEESVLRQGVEALDRISERLEEADGQFDRFCRHVLGIEP